MKLNKSERRIVRDIDQGDFKQVENLLEMKEELRAIAKKFLDK